MAEISHQSILYYSNVTYGEKSIIFRYACLIRYVGDADVEEGKLGLDNVTHQHLQLGLEMGPLHSLLQLGNHSKHVVQY